MIEDTELLAVSMIVVNYNSGALLPRCLRSIESQTIQDYEVIIIDNASSDNSIEAVQENGQIRIIRNPENTGFALAQNQGIRLARGRYVMPLNFDIEMTPRFLEQMISAMQLSDGIGTVTGKLLRMSPEGTRLDEFYSTGHVLPLNRCVYHRGTHEHDLGQYDKLCEVFGAPGAAPLYRREMLEDVAFRGQYFDESLFAWYEDVDLDWRAQRLGWKCVYNPDAVAYHVGHPEGHKGDSWKISTQVRNRWLVILANDHLGPLSIRTAAMLLYELRFVSHVLTRGYLSAYLTALVGFLRLMPLALAKRRWTRQRARSRAGVRPPHAGGSGLVATSRGQYRYRDQRSKKDR